MQEYFCKLIINGMDSTISSNQILIISSSISNLILMVGENSSRTAINLNFFFIKMKTDSRRRTPGVCGHCHAYLVPYYIRPQPAFLSFAFINCHHSPFAVESRVSNSLKEARLYIIHDTIWISMKNEASSVS